MAALKTAVAVLLVACAASFVLAEGKHRALAFYEKMSRAVLLAARSANLPLADAQLGRTSSNSRMQLQCSASEAAMHLASALSLHVVRRHSQMQNASTNAELQHSTSMHMRNCCRQSDIDQGSSRPGPPAQHLNLLLA